jgi:four helix bundle protein
LFNRTPQPIKTQKSKIKNPMTEQELKTRTKQFALRLMKLIDALPNSIKGRVLANQLMRSSTSVAANYRSACRARSTADFISKLGVVEEEADESALWLELITEGEVLPPGKTRGLWQEADELVAIMVASRKSAAAGQQSKIKSQKSKIP